MKTKKRKCAKENSHFGVSEKPRVTLIRKADGSILCVNASAAARYAGVSHQAFSRVIKRKLSPPENPKSVYRSIECKVVAAYPELISNPTIIEG